MTRIGIFGGTFDPPHIGHLILAAEALEQCSLDRLYWVLTPDPPHKQGQSFAPLEQRQRMVMAAIQNNLKFFYSRVDMDRPGPHFAVDTLRLFKRDYPTAELVYVIGSDSLHDLPTWRHPTALVKLVDYFGVMRRPGDDQVDLDNLEAELPGITAKIIWIEAPLLEISSHQIRQRLQEGRAARYYLPEAVYRLIVEQGLYHEVKFTSKIINPASK